MRSAIIVTPVKDSMDSTEKTIRAIQMYNPEIEYIVYNDFSKDETLEKLNTLSAELNFKLINLADFIQSPSPNYDWVLRDAQKRALESNRHLIIVESDVFVRDDSIRKMLTFVDENDKVGMVGAITVDDDGEVCFPYLKFKNEKKELIDTHRSLSFCCTLLSYPFLKTYSFEELDASKDWYDTSISKESLKAGFKNFVLRYVQVVHHAHGSRPWKLLKYTNPLKYYWQKLIRNRDRI
ncbi:MAG: glycosyltransferase [Chitinophagaceae bacterium]|nr:glycosyltransferase [Chitinophagaceae bacterium]